MVSTVITIDGPSGSGKGTLAARLAVHYGFHLLDSGALYRILGLAAQQQGLLSTENLDVDALAALAKSLDIQFVPDAQQRLTVLLNQQDITDIIRTEEIGALASRVAVLPDVRDALLLRQRDFAQAPGLVADGRDMGTVVFMDAPVKIYLTASAEARAERRVRQLQGMGLDASMDDILSDLVARDRRDMERTIAPLRPAEDAFTIDSSNLDIDQVFVALTQYADQQLASAV
ncbi:MAG: (d)CMP kinase [Pseudomonadota bacterium]|nr:(d)CMP kinase [Pseudomonadota bacterium]